MSNPIARAIKNHWTVVPPVKTPELCESEKTIFGCVKFRPWYLFPAAFIIQFCCGSLYSWSVYNKPIDRLLFGNENANRAVNTFYIAVGAFGLTAAFLGPWLERQLNGPRKGLLLGSTTFFIGNIITALGLYSGSPDGIWAVYIGYGLFGGAGLGLNYICPVSSMQKWYVNHRGLASGFAVGGFGAGSIVWSKVILPCIDSVSLPATFLLLSGVMTVTMIFCGLIFRTPPTGHTVHHKDDEHANGSRTDLEKTAEADEADGSLAVPKQAEEAVSIQSGQANTISLIDSITSPDYMFMYIMFFANEIFGLVALSRLSNMAVDLFGKTANEGADIVSINGAFNCCGRLIFAFISDWDAIPLSRVLRRKCVFIFTLATQIVIVASLPAIIESGDYNSFRAVMWLLTFCYGSGFGTIPCFLTDMFGPYNIGALHGIILTAWSIGGVAGGLGFSALYDATKMLFTDKLAGVKAAYFANFNWILVVTIVGFIALQFVRTNPRERFTPGYVLFGITLIRRKEQ